MASSCFCPSSLFSADQISLWFLHPQVSGSFNETIFFSGGWGGDCAGGGAGEEVGPLGDSQATVLRHFRHREGLDFPRTLPGAQWGN